MKKDIVNIGTIGHIDHGRTTMQALMAIEASKSLKEAKTIHEILEEEKTIKFTAPPKLDCLAVIDYDSSKRRFGKGDRARNKNKYGKR